MNSTVPWLISVDMETNSYLDRLLRHMAWANGEFIAQLARFPTQTWKLSLPNETGEEGTIDEIARHFIRSSAFYVRRLDGKEPVNPYDVPTSTEEMVQLAQFCKESDARLMQESHLPDGKTTFVHQGKVIERARSTILGQSIHHATEHRAQIASILTAHKAGRIDLDELDVWSYSDAEGLGD